MKRIVTFILLGFCFSLISCEKESELFLSVRCNRSKVESQSNFYFDIYAQSRSNIVDNISISSYDKVNGQKEVDNFNPNVKVFNEPYYLVAPFSTDTLVVTYTFNVHDSGGNTAQYKYDIRVSPSEAKDLKEMTSLVLTYGDSTKPDAFDFRTLQPVKSDEVDDADIVLNMESSIFSWYSLSNIMFVKQNSFNYSSATDVSLRSAYNNSIRTLTVNDIQSEDVVLVGRVETNPETGITSVDALAVAKIQTADRTENKIWFNLKVIQ